LPFYWPRSHSWSDSASHSFSFGVSAATMQYRGEFASARVVVAAHGICAVVETTARR
jgi:hypothetical protein